MQCDQQLGVLQESGGTSLSTNWKDVGKKTLECEPPDGVKVKKFEF
jgi:suppressor of G2 allele of SKP1